MDEFRQEPVNAPGAARHPPVDAPVALRRPPAHAKTEAQVAPRTFLQNVTKLRDRISWRKVGIIAAVIILLLLIIAAIALSAPGLLNAGQANATAPDATGPGLPGAIPERIIPAQTTVINQGTAVFRDTP